MTNNKSIFKRLADFIFIQSVSADSSKQKEILKAVGFLKKELNRLNFEVNIYKKNNCPPLIIAKKLVSFKAKTLAVYAHYDVQPEDPLEQWDSPPFNLTKKNGKIYGRGVADDKGHLIQVMSAAEKLIEMGKLKNNLVFIFEGEEETGSSHFEELIKKDPDLNNVDAFYIMDFGIKAGDQPEIFFGLRGLIAFELEVTIGKEDLHSGVYGNEVDNPVQIIAELFSKIKSSRTREIFIPGFYKNLKSDNKKNLWFSTKVHPSFDVNGIIGGYINEGVKTIIPASAKAKFSFRLIENQSPEEIEKLVQDFVRLNLPKEIKYTLKTHGMLNPFYTDINNSYIKKTDKILEEVFGKKALYKRSGGSIGAAATLKKIFKKPMVLTGFTLEDCNIHAPNENFDEKMFWKGIESLEKIFAQ